MLHLRLLGLRLHWDAVDYEFFWNILNHLRTGYYTLFNVEFFWSLMASLGSSIADEPPLEEMPEKSAIDAPTVGPWFVYVASFFRPVDRSNITASVVKFQKSSEQLCNLFLSIFVALAYNLCWALALLTVSICGLCSKGHIFFLQLRLHWLRNLLRLERQSLYTQVQSCAFLGLGLLGALGRSFKQWSG